MSPKTYEVCGALPVFENPPGSRFTADLPPTHEAQLIESGSIKPVTTQSTDGQKAKEKSK